MENSHHTEKMIGALLIGTLVGAAVGVLFAPDKGSTTRGKILGNAKDLANDMTRQLKEEANAFRTRAEELEALIESKLEGVATKAKQKIDSLNHLS
ncbi:MAG: YtxH domain-containing protein [bacterium]|nr:YtxH domain-containing protein [bacterium]